MTVSFAIMADMYPPRERGRLFGVFGSVFGIATVIGPFIGGFFTDHGTFMLLGHEVAGWRWVFYVNLPLGLLALFMIMYRMPVLRHGAGGRIDYLGAVLVVLTARHSCSASRSAAPAIRGTRRRSRIVCSRRGLARHFLWTETHALHPILPLHLFRIHAFRIAALASFVMSIGVPRRRDVHAAVHAGGAGNQRDAKRLRIAAADGRPDRRAASCAAGSSRAPAATSPS
jgi:MFS family permease